MFRDFSHNILLLQLRYPDEPGVERFQFFLWNLQRKVAPIEHADFERQWRRALEYPYPDRTAEGPTLSWSVGRPGVVDQPAWEPENGKDEETDEVDGPVGLAMEEGNHGWDGGRHGLAGATAT